MGAYITAKIIYVDLNARVAMKVSFASAQLLKNSTSTTRKSPKWQRHVDFTVIRNVFANLHSSTIIFIKVLVELRFEKHPTSLIML